MKKIIAFSYILLSGTSFTLHINNAAAADVDPNKYSTQNLLIGATTDVQAAASNGAGVTFGVIDTGIISKWIGFDAKYNDTLSAGTSNIDTKNSAVCMYRSCPLKNATITDQNGHGTFVASEIVGSISKSGMRGVAPAAKLLSVQVLGADGSGSGTDLYNGIKLAVDRGAQVLNLSLGPSGTASQQASFYKSIADAVNYAASKGALLVFAGGNAAENLAKGSNITGFTDDAIKHMLFVGSTDANKKISYFSNTPGTAGFTSKSGQFYAYSNMWLMAPGEKIWGASLKSTADVGYGYITQLSGTSMAAPQVTGAAGLLAARWPFLLSKGTIPSILTVTATDLGASGVDATYGSGFLNVSAAMQQVGTLSVPVNGKNVQVGSVSGGSIVAGKALGNLGQLSSALTKAVGYDYFGRDFPLYNSNPVTAKAANSSQSAATLRVTGETGAAARTVSLQDNGNWLAFSASSTAVNRNKDSISSHLSNDPTRKSAAEWSYGFSDNGTYVGVGQGSGAALSFNDARWNGQTAFFNSDIHTGSALLSTVDEANYATTGFALSDNERLAVSLGSATPQNFYQSQTLSDDRSAKAVAVSYSMKPEESWQFSFTSSMLNENNMLLGSTTQGNLLNLGSSVNSTSFGVGANIDLGSGYQLGLDTVYASTSASDNKNSLISGTSRLQSKGFSVALAKQDVTGNKDTLHISFEKPLRVYSGNASLALPVGTDLDGNPIIENKKVSLVPNGSETDINLGYNRPLTDNIDGGFQLSYRNDADNIRGATDAAAMIRVKMSF
ncbi:MAG: S8 family peptidase [Alphaproteobacteria bacterium]